MNGEPPRSAVKTLTGVGTLVVLAAIAVFLAGALEQKTRNRIATNERNRILRTLHELVAPGRYDNDLLADAISVTDEELLGTPDPVTVYPATLDGLTVAAIITAVAPEGYGGPIRLLVGIDTNGTVTGARIVDHQETPGLGAEISQDRSDWIFGFDGRSLQSPTESGWAVKRDGGDFDQFTGATISPRVTVKAVHNALIYFAENRDELFMSLPTNEE